MAYKIGVGIEFAKKTSLRILTKKSDFQGYNRITGKQKISTAFLQQLSMNAQAPTI